MIDKPRKIKEWKYDEKTSEINLDITPKPDGEQSSIYKENRKRFVIGEGDQSIRMDFRDGAWFGLNIEMANGASIDFTSVAIPSALTATLVLDGTGNVTAGDHYYKVTFTTLNWSGDTGETDLGIASVLVTNDATHTKNTLSNIPTSSLATVTGRKIYRTKVGSSTAYYLLTTIADNSTTTYTDNTADASLTGDDATNKDNTTGGSIQIDGDRAFFLGDTNTYVGQNCGNLTTTGFYNTALGARCFQDNTIGEGNTAMGATSLYENTEGDNNTAVGGNALRKNTVGDWNIAIGTESLYENIDGEYNVAVGVRSLHEGTTNDYNVAVGFRTGYALAGEYNVAIGADSFETATTSNYNVIVGCLSGYSLTTGDSNVFLGYKAGYSETTNSNLLYIENSDSATPLIWGDFADDVLKINGELRVNGDDGGEASMNSFTGSTDTPTADPGWASSSTVNMTAPNGYIKAYVGTQAVTIPYWNT